jgi:isopentenyl-diphosphate delta-isomerase
VDSRIILVDENDREVGLEEKLEAHRNGGKLHRAISILIFNSNGEAMLQRRALAKYHAGGQWANTACSHPMNGESVMEAAHRRLREEMGFDCEMEEAFSFTYRADVGSGLTEHEFDHVIFGSFEGKPQVNRDEVSDWKWMDLQDVRNDMRGNPGKYAPWFRIMLDEVLKRRQGQNATTP